MKQDLSSPCSTAVPESSNGDSTKLLSLLALATGAMAMPQTSNADVIFTDLSTNHVVVGTNASPSFLIDNLPGTARLLFKSNQRMLPFSSRSVSAAQAAGYVHLRTQAAFVIPFGVGVTGSWLQMPPPIQSIKGYVGVLNRYGSTPNSFDHMYVVFKFKDSTQVGSPLRYGWIDLSLSNPATGPGPQVTIFGYAFDNTGATLATGFVPEPSSVSLLALGALTLGAKGLRSWRRNRSQAG